MSITEKATGKSVAFESAAVATAGALRGYDWVGSAVPMRATTS